jgi:hypothetical protein
MTREPLEPVLSLEPSNLLAPLDLSEQRVDFGAPSRNREPETSGRLFTRRSSDIPVVRVRRASRWRLKSALIVAGALTCFEAGARLPQLTSLMSGYTDPSQVVESATERSEKQASAPAATIPIKSAEAKPTALSNAGNSYAAPTETAASAGAAVPCNRQTSPDDCPEGAAANSVGGSAPVAAGTPGVARPGPQTVNPEGARRAPVRADAQQEERAQSSRQSKRAMRRDTADQRPAADNKDPIARSVRRENPDAARASGSRRELAADDNASTARRDRDAPREPNWGWNRYDESWGRNRYDEYDARGDDRRVVGRASRQDDRVIGRAPRDDGQPILRWFGNDW